MSRDQFLKQFATVCLEMDQAQTRWILALQSIGIKAAHADDGWIDRSSDYYDVVTLQSPLFDNGVRVGDMIALGDPEAYRVRKVLGIIPAGPLMQLVGKGNKYKVLK